MIFGLKIFLLLCGFSVQAMDLAELLLKISQVKTTSVRFAELKKLQLLDAPIEARGVLSIDKGILIKEIETPIKERLEIDAKEMRIIKAGKTQRLNLAERPEAEALVAGLRAVLTGEPKLLQTHYAVKLTGSNSKWSLLLTPKSDAAKRVLRSLQFHGRDTVIEQIDTTMSNGDQILTTLIQ